MALSSSLKLMTNTCKSYQNMSSSTIDGKFKVYQTEIIFFTLSYSDTLCPETFDRIACWPPTKPGVRQIIPCPVHIFPNASTDGIYN